jgi:uncharacterized protein GlcG (DUF336 family)
MSISLIEADRIIESVFKAAAGRFAPLTVVVTDAGGNPKAFKKQDGGYLLDLDLALGRAFAALSLSPGTSGGLAAFRDRSPGFRVLVESVIDASAGRMVVEPGGVRISDAGQIVIGAVGVAGAAPADCQAIAIEGLKAAGFRAP